MILGQFIYTCVFLVTGQNKQMQIPKDLISEIAVFVILLCTLCYLLNKACIPPHTHTCDTHTHARVHTHTYILPTHRLIDGPKHSLCQSKATFQGWWFLSFLCSLMKVHLKVRNSFPVNIIKKTGTGHQIFFDSSIHVVVTTFTRTSNPQRRKTKV